MIERTFRAAVWVAAALLALGLLLWLGGQARADAVMHAGLWLLIAVPIARVLTALVTWARARDWLFAALTLIVLGSLLVPLVRALAAGR